MEKKRKSTASLLHTLALRFVFNKCNKPSSTIYEYFYNSKMNAIQLKYFFLHLCVSYFCVQFYYNFFFCNIKCDLKNTLATNDLICQQRGNLSFFLSSTQSLLLLLMLFSLKDGFFSLQNDIRTRMTSIRTFYLNSSLATGLIKQK